MEVGEEYCDLVTKKGQVAPMTNRKTSTDTKQRSGKWKIMAVSQ
jgi:ketosteroid isomerase-like protein